MPSRSFLIAIASTAVLAAALAGCSTSTGSSATRPSSGAAATGSPQPSKTPASASMIALPASCPPDSLLENDLGLTVVGTGGSGTASCVYTGVGTIVSINFAISPGMTAAEVETQVRSQGTTSAFQAVPGVGDAAFYDAPQADGTTGSYIAVLSGSVSFHIVTTAEVPVDKMAKVARDIIQAG